MNHKYASRSASTYETVLGGTGMEPEVDLPGSAGHLHSHPEASPFLQTCRHYLIRFTAETISPQQ